MMKKVIKKLLAALLAVAMTAATVRSVVFFSPLLLVLRHIADHDDGAAHNEHHEKPL